MQQPSPFAATQRLEELEELVARMRHDVCGALSPAMLMADMLLQQPDPKVRTAAERIVAAIERTTALVRASRTLVPPRSQAHG
jgi:signal transduction histidine kinase